MDILTGSSGFIGSRIKKLIPTIECIPHELIHTSRIESFDTFYFLSSYGNMAWHSDDQKIIRANILDLVHVLEQIKWDEIKSFVYVSTSSVNLPNQTMYSRTKRAAEEVLQAYIEKYNAPIAIVRPYTVIGVGEQKEHLIPTLIRSAIENTTMPFVSSAYHDFIDVDDVADGIVTLGKNSAKGVFELGTGICRSNTEVKALVEGLTGKIVYTQPVESMRKYDYAEWVCKNFHAKSYGWYPKKSFEQSVREMVEAYEN